MNIKLENNKQQIFFIASIGLVVIVLSIFILFVFSNKQNQLTTSQVVSSSSSSVSSSVTSGPEQIPERITEFYKALPFYSSEFNVEYDKANNQVIVSSTKYEQDQLVPVFKNWINRFPNLKINTMKIKYIGATAFQLYKISSQ